MDQILVFLIFPHRFGTGWNRVFKRFGFEERFKTKDDDDDSVFKVSNVKMEDLMTSRLRETLGKELDPVRSVNHGSFYLRMGAVGTLTFNSIKYRMFHS